MRAVNEKAYLREMSSLIEKAATRWRAKKRPPEIFAIAIWTDAQACASGFNIETRRNSDRAIKRAIEFNKKERAYWLREGDRGMAKLFNPEQARRRNDDPADFEFAMLAEVKHRSFDRAWGQTPAAFKKLVPLLVQARNEAAKTFAAFPLDPEAEVAINTARSWYARPRRLKPAAGGGGGAATVTAAKPPRRRRRRPAAGGSAENQTLAIPSRGVTMRRP
jgi:hypothetical protein